MHVVEMQCSSIKHTCLWMKLQFLKPEKQTDGLFQGSLSAEEKKNKDWKLTLFMWYSLVSIKVAILINDSFQFLLFFFEDLSLVSFLLFCFEIVPQCFGILSVIFSDLSYIFLKVFCAVLCSSPNNLIVESTFQLLFS